MKNSKNNYRTVSILSKISNIYERCIYDQIQLFFYSLLSKYLHVSIQVSWRLQDTTLPDNLVTLLVDNGGAFGELLKKKGGKINDKYSSWSKILIGVPKWSILGPLIFNTLYVVCFTFLRTVILQIIRTTLDQTIL